MDNTLATEASALSVEVGDLKKGHIQEHIDGNLLSLYRFYKWKMIPRCTGRYTCRDHTVVSKRSPIEILRDAGIVDDNYPHLEPDMCNGWKKFHFEFKDDDDNNGLISDETQKKKQKDPILVVPLDSKNQTGIISYIKYDDIKNEKSNSQKVANENKNDAGRRYVHTLNTKSGFRRKLEAIGLAVTNEDIFFPSKNLSKQSGDIL